jgi:hypothetical protein
MVEIRFRNTRAYLQQKHYKGEKMFDQKLIKDIVERAAWTAAQTFLAVYTVGGLEEFKAAATAAVAAGLSVIKGFVGTRVGEKDSAATLK